MLYVIKKKEKKINPLDKKMEKSIDKIAKNRESDLKSSPIWARCSRSNDQNKAGYTVGRGHN